MLLKNLTWLRPVFVLVGMVAVACVALYSLNQAHAQAIWHVDDTAADGLAAHWKFDHAPGAVSTTLDFAGTAHGTALNGAAPVTTTLAPLLAPNPTSFAFDGIDSRVEITDNAVLNLATSFTVAGWARRTSTNNASFLAIYDSGEQANEWWVFIADGSGNPNANDRIGFGERGVADVFSDDANFADTNWHHFAFVKNGDTGANLTFYVDGAPRGTAAVGTVTTPSGPKQIGILQDSSFLAPMDGFLDDLRLYDRALSLVEVQRLAQGKGCVTDGLTWATALRELQCALAEDTDGDTIKVARGNYRPGAAPSVTFTLDRNVTLLGGYAGTGTPDPENRPPFDPYAADAALSVLTGDVVFDDDPTTFANYAENALSVVTVAPGTAPTIDGFRVRGGNAVKPNTGGGMRVQAGALGVSLANVSFFANRTTASGAGIFAQAPTTISNSAFVGNSGGAINDFGSGGAIAITATLRLTDTDFLSNTMPGGNGGAIQGTAPMIVNGGLFQNNIARLGGLGNGGAINGTAAMTITSATFVKNLAGGDGGAVSGSSGTMLVAGSSFLQNQTNSAGGALAHSGSTLEIQSSTFQSNTTRFFGGAVYASGFPQVAWISDSTFVGNSAQGANCGIGGPLCTPTSGRGAAIAAMGALTVDGGSFTGNQAKIDGGAIAALGPATIRNATLAQNKAGFPPDSGNTDLGNGGGIFATAVITIEGGTVTQNQAQMLGGGTYITGAGVITGVTISQNQARAGGGLNITGPVTITLSQFADNVATNGGGGAFVTGGAAIAETLFARNVTDGAASDGGGLLVQTGPTIVATSTFTGNTAVRFGGGARLANATVNDSYFGYNQTSSEGGGLLSSTNLTVTHTILESNLAHLSGAIGLSGSQVAPPSVLIANSLFVDNRNSSRSGVTDLRIFDLNAQLVNNTFAGLTIPISNSVNAFRSDVTAANNIFANYSLSLLGDISSTVTEDHNLFFNAPIGPSVTTVGGTLSGDPLFVDAAAHNFRLQLGSPAIDAGSDAVLPALVTVDLDGLSRPFDVVAIAGTGAVDMGAYEFHNQFPVAAAGGPLAGSEGSPVALDGSNSADDKSILSFAWDCTDDGSFDRLSNSPTGDQCTYPDNGSFVLRLRVVDNEGASAETTSGVTIANAIPEVTPPANQSAIRGVGKIFNLGSFADPGPDAPWQVTVDWGDGQTSILTPAEPGPLPTTTHTYAAGATFDVVVTVADKDGGAGSAGFTVTATPPSGEIEGAKVYLPYVDGAP